MSQDEIVDRMWDQLLEIGVSEQTLQIVTAILGYTPETMECILYAHAGYRGFDQLLSELRPTLRVNV